MKANSLMSLSMASVMIFTLFMPFSYGFETSSVSYTAEQPQTIDLLNIKNKATGEGCANVVQTVDLEWAEYEALIKAANGTIAGFGNAARQTVQEQYTANTLSPDASVNSAKNQFVMTDSGPMYVFNVLQFGTTNPADSCQLTNIVTKGYISYVSNLDQNLRFCSEYPSTVSCENGRITSAGMSTLTNAQENAKKTAALQTQIESSSLDWSKVKEAVNNMNFADNNMRLGIIGDIDAGNYDKAKENIAKLIDANVQDVSMISSTPWNYVESNSTTLALTSADQVFMFPHNLAAFVKMLRDQSGTDSAIAVLDMINTVASVASIRTLFTSASHLTRNGKLISSWKKLFEEKSTIEKTLENSLKQARTDEKYMQKQIKTLTEKLDAKTITPEEQITLTRYNKELPDLQTEITNKEKLLSKVQGTGSEEDMKAVMTAKTYSSSTKFTPTSIINDLEQTFKDTSQYDVVAWEKAREDLDLAKTYLGSKSAYTKLAEEAGKVDASPQAKETLNKVQDIVSAKTGTPTTEPLMNELMAGETIVGGASKAGSEIYEAAITNEQYYNLPSNGLSPSSKIMENYKATEKFFSWGGLAGRLNVFAYKWLASAKKLYTMGQGFAHFAFFLKAFDSQPTAILTVDYPVYTLTPKATIQGADESYLDLIKTAPVATGMGDYDFYPKDFIANVMNFLNLDFKKMIGEDDYSPVMKKTQAIGDYVTIMDQETQAQILTEESMPVNLLSTRAFSDQTRWYFSSFSQDDTKYYGFENPSAYYKLNGQFKYTTMALAAWNIDITAIGGTLVADGANYGSISSMVSSFLPSAGSFAAMSLVGGFYAPIGTLNNQVIKQSVQVLFATILGGQVTELGKSVYNKQVGYVPLVDMKEAYGNSSQLCSKIIGEEKGKVDLAGKIKTGVSVANTAMTVVDLGSKIPSPFMPYFIAAQIFVSALDYWATENYMNAKDQGLAALKSCYETEFEILAWQKINTQEATAANISTQFLSQGVTGVAGAIGTALSALSPEVRNAVTNIGENYYQNTLSLSGVIEGESRVNLYASKVYQVHFDKDATIKWFANQQCGIDMCSQNADGTYKCMTKQGYFLLDADGNIIFEGPQVAFLSWSNLETYASIPQKVINIKQDTSKFMNIYSSGVNITNACVLDEISNLTKTPSSDTNVKGTFGDLEVIETGDESIWFDGNDVAVSFFKEKTLGTKLYGASQTARFPGAHLEIARDGSVSVISSTGEDVLGGSLPMAEDGVISFGNAMFMPGKQDTTTRNNNDYTVSSKYNAMDGAKVLHLFIRELLTFQGSDVEDLSITGSCGDGTINGITLTGTLETDDSDQLQQLLNEMCFSDFTNGDNSSISIRDGMLCRKDSAGKETCSAIKSIDGSGIKLADGSTYDLGVDSTGVPWWYYTDPTGAKSQIPLMWMNGLGGSMFYNGQTGQISIKNEFPFSIASSYNQYGALAGAGLSLPGTPDYGGRTGTSVNSGNVTSTNLLASLPGVPEQPAYFIVFILILFSALIAVRINGKEE